MPHFIPDNNSLSNLDYTPQFYCRHCNAGVPAVCLSERKACGGVVREIACPVCQCLERVGIQLAEDFSGWVFFRADAPGQDFEPDDAPECPAATDQNR